VGRIEDDESTVAEEESEGAGQLIAQDDQTDSGMYEDLANLSGDNN
jgi:hypothetical protein